MSWSLDPLDLFLAVNSIQSFAVKPSWRGAFRPRCHHPASATIRTTLPNRRISRRYVVTFLNHDSSCFLEQVIGPLKIAKQNPIARLASVDNANGAPASGPALWRERVPKAPGRRPTLRRPVPVGWQRQIRPCATGDLSVAPFSSRSRTLTRPPREMRAPGAL